MNRVILRISLGIAGVMTALGAWIFLVPNSDLADTYLLPADVPVLYRSLVAFMLFLFAAMYAWMATQSNVPRTLLWLGAIGKGGAFATVLALFLAGQVPLPQVIMMVGDALLAGYWFAWLLLNKKRDAAEM